MKHKGLKITLLVVLLLVAAPVAAAYGCFYTTKTTTMAEPLEGGFSKTMQKKLGHGLDDTASTGKFQVSVSEKEMNGLIAEAYSSLPEEARHYVTGVSLDVTNETYDFACDLKVPAFQTEVLLKTKLSDITNAENPLEGRYEFQIQGVRIGRAGMESLAFHLLSKYVTDAQLESAMAANGIHIQANLKEGKLYYEKASLLSDLKAILKKDGENDTTKLLTGLLSTVAENNLLTLDPNDAESLTATVSMEKFASNPKFTDSRKNKGSQLSRLKENLDVLLEKSIISPSQSDALFSYLMRGYAYSDEDVRKLVDPLDLSSIGIEDPRTYVGPVLGTSESLSDVLRNQFSALTLAKLETGTLATITESQLSDAFLYSGIYGSGKTFVNEEEKKANFVVLDNAYTDIQDGKMSLVVGVSLNGYETSLILDTSYVSFDDLKLTLHVEEADYGTVALEGDLKDYLYQTIEKQLAAQEDKTLSFDAQKENFTLDVKASLTSGLPSPVKDLVHVENVTATLSGKSLEDEGVLTIGYTASL